MNTSSRRRPPCSPPREGREFWIGVSIFAFAFLGCTTPKTSSPAPPVELTSAEALPPWPQRFDEWKRSAPRIEFSRFSQKQRAASAAFRAERNIANARRLQELHVLPALVVTHQWTNSEGKGSGIVFMLDRFMRAEDLIKVLGAPDSIGESRSEINPGVKIRYTYSLGRFHEAGYLRVDEITAEVEDGVVIVLLVGGSRFG